VVTVTDDGFKEQLNPVDGDTDAARLTLPLNPSRLVTVIVDVPGFPAKDVTVDIDAIEKSCIV